jgi:O-methyltransferase involved in polyketide biosynthesis
MNNVNKTLYIPLYGKAYLSERGIILSDKWARDIWEKEQFKLGLKSKSKWLAYYMGMRARVFDDWLCEKLREYPEAVVLHIGCGLDSRIQRVGAQGHSWFDIDFPQVIAERRRYFSEDECYKMIGGNICDQEWIMNIELGEIAVVVMEGVSMYLSPDDLFAVLTKLRRRFNKVHLLMDSYTTFAAKASRFKNPINEVGVTKVYGIDDPTEISRSGLRFLCEREMTPSHLIAELPKSDRPIFSRLYAGKTSSKLYKLYEFESVTTD